MKKFIAGTALALMLLGGTTAQAVVSPTPTPPEDPVDKSPKTSDFNIIYVEALGAFCVLVAAAAGIRSRKNA